jgi:hypothetical protein
MLGVLDLSAKHRADLQRRGLVDSEIDLRQYRTWRSANTKNVLRALSEKIGTEKLLSIPGVVQQKELWLNAPAGLLIPVRNIRGQVIALKVRRDTGPNRYLYLSSRSFGGPGPGSPAHVPVGVSGPSEVVRITEGELKADMATVLSNVPTVSFPGIASWRCVIPVLASLNPKYVRLAFDADMQTNPHVARALCSAFYELGKSYRIELEQWQATDGKGIDDLLANGCDPNVLSEEDAIAAVREIARKVGLDRSLFS